MGNILKMAGCSVKHIKIGTWGPRNSVCGILIRSGDLTSVWARLVDFATFPMLRFSKGHCPNSFRRISAKLYEKHGNQGINFLGDPTTIENFMAL